MTTLQEYGTMSIAAGEVRKLFAKFQLIEVKYCFVSSWWYLPPIYVFQTIQGDPEKMFLSEKGAYLTKGTFFSGTPGSYK